MKVIRINVELGERSYPIHIGQGALEEVGKELARLVEKCRLLYKGDRVYQADIRNPLRYLLITE